MNRELLSSRVRSTVEALNAPSIGYGVWSADSGVHYLPRALPNAAEASRARAILTLFNDASIAEPRERGVVHGSPPLRSPGAAVRKNCDVRSPAVAGALGRTELAAYEPHRPRV